MKKLLLSLAVSTAVLAACSQNSAQELDPVQAVEPAAEVAKKSDKLDMDKINAERAAEQARWEAEAAKPPKMTPEAKAVFEQVEKALANTTSVDAQLISVKDSDMYGHEKVYEGRIVFEFGGKAGTKGRTWYEAKETAKGKTKHIRGVNSAEGLKELHLLKEKVVTGGPDASSATFIAGAFWKPYGAAEFMELNKGYLGGDTVELAGQQEVAGVLCNVIKAFSSDSGRNISRYYFGVEDGQLYRSETEINSEDGKQVSYTEVVSMTVNQPLPADQFELEVPEHFAIERYVAPWDQKSMATGVVAPDWTLPGSDGKQHSLSDYRGQLVLLDFWATWCGPCKAKMPHIQEIHEEFKDKGLKVISVLSGDEGHEEEALEYIQDKGYTFDLVYGNEKLSDQYMIRFLPTVMLVDREGVVIHHRDSPGINDGIDEEIELHNAITDYLDSTDK